MFSAIFKKRPTSKADVALAVFSAFMATWKAVDTVKDYREDNSTEEIEK